MAPRVVLPPELQDSVYAGSTVIELKRELKLRRVSSVGMKKVDMIRSLSQMDEGAESQASDSSASTAVSRSASRSVSRSVSASAEPSAPATPSPAETEGEIKGANWVEEGGVGQGTLMMPLLLFGSPLLCQSLAYITTKEASGYFAMGVTGLAKECVNAGVAQCGKAVVGAALSPIMMPTYAAVQFLALFSLLAYLLDVLLPGQVETGPVTRSGHVPAYVDNGVFHCVVFSFVFYALSNFGYGFFDFGIMYDLFAPCLTTLNIFGFAFCFFLYFKGLNFPSTKDSGSTGSFLADFAWGTELYPRVLGVDVKRFINCRFSMTFWMLAGLSFAYRSYTLHNTIDWGLTLAAISQYIYLVKFFWWEIGYMRSIDIIVDRAGWEIQWGCLVFVPSVYTFHSRLLVQHPSQWSPVAAGVIFIIGMLGVAFNYIADRQRQLFRECNGNMKIWGKDPVYIKAEYTVESDGAKKEEKRTSLLLASGWWGVARHFHYVFELTAAYSWCFLANPFVNGLFPLLYCTFLTILLLHRAKRDEKKCRGKYGKDYDKYAKLVPYLVIPGIY